MIWTSKVQVSKVGVENSPSFFQIPTQHSSIIHSKIRPAIHWLDLGLNGCMFLASKYSILHPDINNVCFRTALSLRNNFHLNRI